MGFPGGQRSLDGKGVCPAEENAVGRGGVKCGGLSSLSGIDEVVPAVFIVVSFAS